MTITLFDKSKKQPTPEEIETAQQQALAMMRDADRSILTAVKMLPALNKLRHRYDKPAIAYDALIEFITQQAEWAHTLVWMYPDEARERYQEAYQQEERDDAFESSEAP